MHLTDLPTPCLLLDRAKLEANTARMRQRATALGVTLRPHCKTAKSAEVARIAHGIAPDDKSKAGPITVSTLAEAEYFASHGFTDILYAVGITPQKLDRAAALIRRGVDLKLLTDHPGIAAAIAEHGRAQGIKHRVMIEVDTGLKRAGIEPDAPELESIAAALAQGGAEIAGVLTHAGHSYHAHSVAEIERIAEEERAGAVRAAERLRRLGHAAPIVSVGSTPTALHAKALDGITEMRPGVYVFFDLFQAGLKLCGIEDIAVSVLASVNGRQKDHLLIDAGGLALSKDTGANEHTPGTGFGLVLGLDAALPELHVAPNLHVTDVHQEHGLVTAKAMLPDLAPGTKLRVLPNHACFTAAAYDRYYVIENGKVTAEWERARGW